MNKKTYARRYQAARRRTDDDYRVQVNHNTAMYRLRKKTGPHAECYLEKARRLLRGETVDPHCSERIEAEIVEKGDD